MGMATRGSSTPSIRRCCGLRHIVKPANDGGIVAFGRPVLRYKFACDDWLLDKLAALGAVNEYREGDDPAEQDDRMENTDSMLA